MQILRNHAAGLTLAYYLFEHFVFSALRTREAACGRCTNAIRGILRALTGRSASVRRPFSFRCVFVVTLACFSLPFFSTSSYSVSLPNLLNTPRPTPTLAAPAGWDIFSPPVAAGSVAPGAPTVAEWTRTGGSDDCLVVTGDKLSNFGGDDEGKDSGILIFGQTTAVNSINSDALIQRIDGTKIAITLPQGLPAWSTYLLWPRNSSGYGYPVAINRTDAWWIGPNQATRGDTVSVYGRNLSHDGGTTTSWIYLKSTKETAEGAWIPPISVNPYRVQFVIPTKFGNGTYEVWVHNGHGGSYGWSGPLTLTVNDAYQWSGSIFNVRNPAYGATGDGVTDDTDAVLKANDAALHYRDSHPAENLTLYFPAGTYMMHAGLSFRPNFRFLGDGKDLTTLRCNEGFKTAGTSKLGLLFASGGSGQNLEVTDLTLDANDNVNQGANQDHLVYALFTAETSGLRFTNVRIRVSVAGIGCAFFNNVTNLRLKNCEFIGGELMLLNGKQQIVENCFFYGANDSPQAIFQRHTSDLAITGCLCADLDITSQKGQGLGRFVAANSDYGTQTNVYIGDNTTVNCGPRESAKDQNSGEQVMCEGNDTHYKGTPTAASATTATFGDLVQDFTGKTVVICTGKGLGQYRQIVSCDSGSGIISLDRAWNVIPDSTSTLLIVHAANKWVVYHNSFNGKNDYAQRYTGKNAISLDGGCYDWIGDSNTITNMYYALYNTGAYTKSGPLEVVNPCYFNYFTNNYIIGCHNGIFHGAGIPSTSTDAGVASLGNLYRSNTVNGAEAGIALRTWAGALTPSTPVVDMSVFEHNVLVNVASGADLDIFDAGGRLINNSILYKNNFTSETAARAGSYGVKIGSKDNVVLANNTWTGFDKTYTGAVSDAVLELLLRTFDVQVSSGAIGSALTIRNSGPASLSWSASSDCPWLTVFPASGTIASEKSISTITLTSNPTNLSPGTYTGTITVMGGAQARKASLTLTVGSTAPQNAHITVSVMGAMQSL